MKTSSLFTITGIVAFALLGITRFNGQDYLPEVKDANDKLVLAQLAKDQDNLLMHALKGDAQKSAVLNTTKTSKSVNEISCDLLDNKEICLDQIIFLETEDEIELGFDVNAYLPADFDPYAQASTELDLNSVQFIEADNFDGLGFDTALYLPEGFDPYAGMELDLGTINFIETEDEAAIELGFDTSAYLPEGFNPYALPELELEDILFIEEEEVVELGFDVNAYLPADFDPYAAADFDLDQIIYIEETDDSAIWEGLKDPAANAAYTY